MNMKRFPWLAAAFLAAMSLSPLSALADEEKEASPAERVPQAIALLQSGQVPQGLPMLRKALQELDAKAKSGGASAEELHASALGHFELQQDAQALEALESLLKIEPGHVGARLLKGKIFAYGGEPAKAEAMLRGIVQEHPDNAEAWEFLIGFYMENGQRDKAFKAVSRMIELQPGNALFHFHLGGLKAGMGDEDGAIQAWLKAAELDPSLGDAQHNIGQVFQNRGDLAEAAKHYALAIQVDRDDWHALTKLVQISEALGDTEAREKYRARLYEIYADPELKEKSFFGEVPQKFYTIDQFKIGEYSVHVFEYFEYILPDFDVKGWDFPVKYSFNVFKNDIRNDPGKYRITLGSYEATNEFAHAAKEIGPDDRLYHLDGYYPNSHRTFQFFVNEPSYDEVKRLVIQIVKGELKSSSSTTVGSK
jgi:tetratricopeptide (TPR) repeat protein